MYRTVIIEDDPVITQLNRQYVEKDSRFTVVQTFSAAHPALFWLRNNLVDLIILDMYMPQMSGLELLRILRAEGVNADVIMVTAASEARHVSELYSYGVSDYLIKPFDYNRFQTALRIAVCFIHIKLSVFQRQFVGVRPASVIAHCTFLQRFASGIERHSIQHLRGFGGGPCQLAGG